MIDGVGGWLVDFKLLLESLLVLEEAGGGCSAEEKFYICRVHLRGSARASSSAAAF